MMILKVGDTQKAACYKCEAFETVTFKLRDVPFNDDSGIVKNVLVGVCNKCSSVAVLPHQSTPMVQKQLAKQRGSIESRVPAHFIDILNLASVEISGNIDFAPSILKFYIHALLNGDIPVDGVPSFINSDLFQGQAQKRLSLKGRLIVEEVERLKKLTNIPQTTDLLKSVVLKINEDLLVKKDQNSIHSLKGIAAATA
ncbi:hypothetical protein OAY_10195 [Vibrio cyclitrophicus ZF205]|uniref:hypothetical protein n=1 Tax=Vibrio cyclitrophicus TaxID=47951 RepID=UPI00037B62A0|nr:hypothetical protein [Vibrio cyclitrophicus]OEE18289.1 hypothetical protein OAY_10195 [Vibrio cyclitrophicus ZF205]